MGEMRVACLTPLPPKHCNHYQGTQGRSVSYPSPSLKNLHYAFELFKAQLGEAFLEMLICESPDELQESLRPSGPEIPKKSEKSLPGPPAPGSQKVWKKSRKSPEQTFSRLFSDFLDFFETFSRLLGHPGPPAPGDFFFRLFGDFGPGGPESLL